MTANRMRAAVIGVGPHGRRIIGMLKRMPAVEIVAIADQREAALDGSDAPPATRRYRDAMSLLAETPADLVCITTNGPSHAPLALAALEHGATRLLVEKPMACSLRECDELAAAALRKGARLAVDQMRRMDTCYRWLRRRIHSGDWGALRQITIQRNGIGLGCLGTHSFDLIRFLADRDVSAVTAWVDQPLGKNPRGESFQDPGGLVVMQLGQQVRAVVVQIEDGSGPMTVEIDLTGARVRIDEKAMAVEIVERDLSVKPGPGRPAAYRTVAPPAEVASRFEMPEQVQLVLEELISDEPLSCGPEHGVASVEILVAAHLSSRRGNIPVALPLNDPEARDTWLPIT
jgi:predicted dehydrogenase